MDRPAEADFVLNTGPDDHLDPSHLEDFEPLLEACAVQKLPMVCANPDREVIRGGVRVLCAGALARRYREFGGEVRMVGKPDPTIYAPVFAMLGLPRERVLAVGDGLETDIAGAAAAGIKAAWVLGGIHEERLRDGREADRGCSHQAARPIQRTGQAHRAAHRPWRRTSYGSSTRRAAKTRRTDSPRS